MELNIKRLVVGQLSSNCYLVYNEDDLIIIDPGDDAEYIKGTIKDIGITPKAILATHGHFDHILAASELQLVYKIPFIIDKNDQFLVKRMNESARYFIGETSALEPEISAYIDESVKLNQKHWFEVIKTYGHTPGSVSFFNKENKILISGDLIFEGGSVGRTDYQYASEADQIKSIDNILKLPGDTLVYSGHGGEFTIDEFKNYHYNRN